MTTKYPSSWQNIRLSDCCTRVTRKNKAGISLVLTASGEFGLVDQREFFNKQVAPKNLSGYYHLKKGEFAYNRSSMKGYPYGAIKRLDRYEDGALSTLYLCFKVSSSDADPCYMEHLFESSLLDLELQPIARVGARAHGLLNVTPREFMDIQLCLPPLPEQKKIAAILSSVDETIQATLETIEQTKKLKQGLMQELLTKGIGHTRFKKTEIGEIPEEWDFVTLGSVSDIRRGASPRPIQDQKWFSDNGYGWIRIEDVSRQYKYLRETKQYLSEAGVRKSVPVHNGDVIMSICATIGMPSIVEMDACIHDGFVLFAKLSHRILREYLFYYLLRRKESFSGKGQPGTQKNINTSIVKQTSLPLPPLEEQREIADILSGVDYRIDEEETNLEQLQLLKKGLMQDLLSGKVRVAV